ncbi:hypothetical protein K505DRAFT_372009 [Melanomma pulvis-pyrius CBS 109.77]|uniref:Uncharacterized protein n=1 Tax=Melanomma pulvis-pyrius CBS 109.77 TaxID=1314802 RepID=A0A6A6XPH1_9PLEO|nr:hypothetical protein K505DRAFT_372009 [Melanomma pulvis-pyrius CBS 109.77]
MVSFFSCFVAILSLGLFHGTLSTPTLFPQSIYARDDPPPPADSAVCGKIIDMVNQGYAYFYASEVFECLTSVPFHAAVAIRFLTYLNETIQFQSTLAYLKNPPEGYQRPPVDLLGGLQTIQNNITAGYYRNQYAFEADVQHLLYSAHDAHLTLTAGAMAAFSFLAPFRISSVSTDGKELPKVYVTEDIIEGQKTGETPSAIKTINNKNVTDYLTEIATLNGFGNVEPHADWNQLFTTPTLDILGDESVFSGYVAFYQEKYLNVTFENGVSVDTFWVARYNNPYHTGPLTTGGDFYNYFVLNHLPASYNETTAFNAAYTPGESSQLINITTTNSWNNISSGAYPDPDLYQPGLAIIDKGVLSGYWLEDVDAAVLSIPTFDQTGYGIGNFSETVAYFLGNASDKNLSRAIIDLQQNTGGTVELVFSTFKRFFPDLDPEAQSRRRSHPLGNILGESYTSRFDNLTKDGANDIDTVANEWVITPRLNAATGQNFTSWAEYYSPVEENQDNFSVAERYNLSSVVFDRALFDSWIPWGYTDRFPEDGYRGAQTFAAENITLLTDGACSSACSLLVELFTQAGARTVVVGGRPSTGPMQAVGGNRGAAAYSADALDNAIAFIGQENDTAKALLPQLADNGYRDSGVYTTVLGVNLRDQVRPQDPVPLQFKYEAADCRIFYTLGNIYNMSRLWRDALSASYDDSLCVEGSTGHSNSTIPAPEALNLGKPTLNHGEGDGLAFTFELSGGLQDFEPPARADRITSCENGATCNNAGECRLVSGLPCSSGQLIETLLCVNDVPNKDFCQSGTIFEANAFITAKSVLDFNGKPQAIGTYTGFCLPITATPAWCRAFGV